ncbi:MAG: hypothetical protein Kow00129_04350 [Thermoleophilia bacterium]
MARSPQKRHKNAATEKGAPVEPGPVPSLSQGRRLVLWVLLGLLPPLVAAALLPLIGRAEPNPPVTGAVATILNFALLIMALTTFNVIFQGRSRWAGPSAHSSTFLSGLASSSGVAVGGLIAYLLTGSLMTGLVLLVISLGAGALLRPMGSE